MRKFLSILVVAGLVHTAHAAYIIEVDTDGTNDSVIAYNPDFAFGNDTDTASPSAPSSAYGTTGGDSIYGGNGVLFPDTYVFTYAPDSQADNLAIPAGTDLGDGNFATGLVGGIPGTYRVYATWPFTDNVSGGPTSYEVMTNGDDFTVAIDQNGKGNEWIWLGDIDYTDGRIIVTQTSEQNSFVSMRAAGVMFELVPEPTSMMLLSVGALALLRRR